MFPRTKSAGAFDEFHLELKSNTKSTVSINQADFLNQLIKVSFGKSTGLQWKLNLDGENISNGCPKKCIYLPNPGEIPVDITGMQLLNLFKRILRLSKEDLDKIMSELGEELLQKRFKHVDNYDKAQILLGISRFFHPGVYILKDFSTGILPEQWKELESHLDSFLDKNTIIIDITTNDRYWLSKPDTQVFVIYKNGKYHAKYRRIFWEISDQKEQ
jgi:ABC-type multidrug transport system ATPase subunit